MLSSLVQPWIQDILSTPCVPHTGTVTDSVSHDHHMHENTHGGDSNNSMHNNSSSGVLWTAGAASYVVHIVASVRLIQNAWDLLHHFKVCVYWWCVSWCVSIVMHQYTIPTIPSPDHTPTHIHTPTSGHPVPQRPPKPTPKQHKTPNTWVHQG